MNNSLLPDSWKYQKLGEIGTTLIGLTYSPSNVSEFGTLVLRSSNIQNNQLAFDNNVFVDMELPERVIVKEKDLLICVRNGSRNLIGKCTLIDKKTEGSAFGAFMSIFRSSINEYVFHVFRSEVIQKQIRNNLGATINQITNNDLANFYIPVPPLAEQQKIAQALTDADNYISALEKLIEKKKMMKEGLMVNLLTGKQRLKEFAFNEDGTAKGYKDSELGKIPEDWDVIELIDTASKSKKWSFVGGPFGSSLKTDDYTEYGIQIIQLQNMGDGHFINDNVIYTSVEKANELLSNNIYAGEIIISKMGDPVARACIMPNHADRYLMASDGIRLSIDTNKFDTRFIHDFINFKIFRNQAINASTGSTRQRISLSELKKLKLFSPSYEEQLAIGNTFKDLDSQILVLDQKLNKAKLLKQGMMQKLLTGEIRLA